MKQLSIPGFHCWSVFSQEKQMDFNGHLWVRKDGNILIDPVAMQPSDLAQLEALGGAKLCVITNADHTRDMKALRDRLRFEVVCHPLDKQAIGIAEARTVDEGEEIVPGLQVIHLAHGKTPGEMALWLPEFSTVLVGDSLQGAPIGAVRLPADSKLASPAGHAIELRKLLALPLVNLLVGDGHSLFGNARDAVLRCLEARTDIELHHIDPESLPWVATSYSGRYAHHIKRVSAVVGARKLAYNLRRLPPGGASGPLHYHPLEEELFVVLEGHCSLETRRGKTPLETGAFVACPAGEHGTHRLVNDTKETCVVLCLSDVVPDDAPEQAGLVEFRGDLVSP